MTWLARRRAAVEAAAFDVLADPHASAKDRADAKQSLLMEVNVERLKSLTLVELNTLRALQSKLLGLTTELVLRVVGEPRQREYRPCATCNARLGRHYVDVSEFSDGEREGIEQAIASFRRNANHDQRPTSTPSLTGDSNALGAGAGACSGGAGDLEDLDGRPHDGDRGVDRDQDPSRPSGEAARDHGDTNEPRADDRERAGPRII